MLKSLYIKNYALIDLLEVSFKDGLTTITGETGTGKSILLGGFSLVLGKRADLKSLKIKTEKCVIEATFDITNHSINSFFEKHGLDYSPQTIVRREILPSGKSRAFINDTPVTLDVLASLGTALIDVHSQFETQKIADTNFLTDILDAIAYNQERLKEYKDCYKNYLLTEKEILSLKTFQESASKEYEYNLFLFKELESINLYEGLVEELEIESEKLSNVETIKETLSFTLEALNNEEAGALNVVREISNRIDQLSNYGNEFKTVKDRIKSALIELDDIFSEIENLSENVETDPNRLNSVDETIQKIYNLQRKHQTESLTDLLNIKEALSNKLEKTNNIDTEITECQKTLKEQEKKLKIIAKSIHEKREAKAPILKLEIETMLKDLGMPNVRFLINIEKQETFLSNGSDKITFLFSANKGTDFGSIKKIASGGERSRIMLVIKAILCTHILLPTIIFDEIDTGISGEIAKRVAILMAKMAKKMQVITITHSPQIAAKGSSHFKVFKDSSTTQIKPLILEDRVLEIAEMIDGKQLSNSAIKHAKELLQQS